VGFVNDFFKCTADFFMNILSIWGHEPTIAPAIFI